MTYERPPLVTVIQYEAPLVEEYNVYCECVATARIYSKFELPRQDANKFKPNSTPTQGGLVLFNYYGVSHVAVIHSLMPGGVWIQEGNYNSCEYSERFVRFDDPRVTGFWQEID